MNDASPVPPGCRLRPAHSTDRWMIQTLLQTFDQEVPSPPNPYAHIIRYAVLGGLVAIAVHIVKTASIQVLLLLALYAAGMVLLWLIVLFSIAWFSNDWSKYWVVECNGHLVACAKLCRYKTHSAIYNVFVADRWRKQGIGSCLMQQLIQEATRPLYLACFTRTISFYQQLGFSQVPPKDLSPLLRYELGLSSRLNVVPMRLA
ncbi:GNAT family N-acetyltransferase [Oculatella sp. LEGE 06141]|uniref:GNAT family N-acetyltransferase n=1 Tax=Oculatella sp. LEGE 06141 TaxID=1828648 RepID=UPI00188249B9|nr:GNAT family N-acetyltransferase [Oculatella sp. LEGE 06141]MBE9182728.1 GNAT family N-acetyltransferase [Oculatella sp. LEGE 06141]